MLQSEFVICKLQHGFAIDLCCRASRLDTRCGIVLYLHEIVGKQSNASGNRTAVYKGARASGTEDRRARILRDERYR